MCIPIRGKGGEKEKGSKLWQSLRKCCLYSPNDNFKKNKKRKINKPQTNNKPPNLKQQNQTQH